MQQGRQQLTPFQFSWYSFGLPGYRPCLLTYQHYPYDDLPPLPQDQLIGKLQWLVPLEPEIDALMQPCRPPAEWRPDMGEMMKEVVKARQVGLSLSDTFLQFMASTELQDRVPSVSDCWFRFSSLVPCPCSTHGYIMHFLQDNQGCVFWYLYLSPNGEECVLAAHVPLDLIVLDSQGYGDISEEEILQQTYVCASSFEAFLYRFWMENMLALYLHIQKPLTAEQKQYLAYYTRKSEEQRCADAHPQEGIWDFLQWEEF